MQFQTHMLSGWCIGNHLGLSAKERFLCIFAAGIHDLDGLGYFIKEEYYYMHHHVYGHNIFIGFIIAGLFAWMSDNKKKSFWCYLGFFHLHLLMDFFGSGPGWGLAFFWPFYGKIIQNPLVWEFMSWQNMGTAAIFYLWTFYILYSKKRTFLEFPMPSLDKKIVDLFLKVKKIIPGFQNQQ